MVFTKKNEEAVSPVIGTILMVAITVILAAVIFTQLMPMVGNVQSTKVVAFTVERVNSTAIQTIFHGGQDAAKVASVAYGGNVSGAAWSSTPAVGQTNTTLTPTGQVILVVTFTDGSKQVVFNQVI